MIISHKHKFIFIKPQKTAGTSVELMLSRICGDDDIITPLGFDPDPNVREKHNAKPPQNFYRKKPLKHWQISEVYHWITKQRKPNLNYWEHLQADLIKQYVGSDIWNSYKKISIVRNPWDHARSQFLWVKKYGYNGSEHDFAKFLELSYISLFPFFFINGEYILDNVLTFENLENDCRKFLEKFNIKEEFNLPLTKNKINKGIDINDFYNRETSKLIYKKNKFMIEQFNYKLNE